jgi:formate hydrogenlyase transcriptional activator
MSLVSKVKKDKPVSKNESSPAGNINSDLYKTKVRALTLRQKKDLHELIRQIAATVINFDVMSINLLTDDLRTHHTYFYYAHEGKNIDNEFIKNRALCFPVTDDFFNVTIENELPLIWKLDEMIMRDIVPDFARHFINAGIAYVVGVSLSDGENKIGNAFWGFTNKEGISEQSISDLREISFHIGHGIANMLALENTLQRLKESATCLNFSNTLFSARDKTTLLSVLNTGLKALFRYSGLMIVLNDEREDIMNPYAIYFDENRVKVVDDGPVDPRRQVADTRLFHNVLSSTEATTWLMKDLINLMPRPEFITRHRANGIKEVMGVSLVDNRQVEGAIFLFSEESEAFQQRELSVLNMLAPQIAKTLANVRFLEGMARKKRQQDVCATTTRALIAVRDTELLQQVMKKAYTAVPFFDEGFIYFVPSKLPLRQSIVFKQRDLKLLPEKGIPNAASSLETDLFLDSLRQLKDLTVGDINDYFNGTQMPPYVSQWAGCGMKTFVAAPFVDDGIITGIFFFLSKETHTALDEYLYLFHNIVAQITAAILNSFTNERLTNQLKEVSQFKGQLEIQNSYLQEEIQSTHNYSEIIGASTKMRDVFHMVSQVAKTNSSVLILGETGTGKELIARAIHNMSQRKGNVMVKVNCGALPENLIESELFGHERGSFTGATERRIGKFELANNSTIFLDEIGELPMSLQVKLLRALQEKEIERVGGKSTIKVDVRVIAATNRDLLKDVQQGNFRGDLYFRLNVFPVLMPPLRERKEDIPILANHFAEKYAKKLTVNNVHFTSKVMKQMVAYNWPGNVRELEHLVERSVLLAKGKTISQVYLPQIALQGEDLPLANADVKTLDEVEREHIISVLKMVNGKIAGVGGAAEILKIPATTLASKILRLKIKKGIV